jgi:hypothetical protein
MTAARINASPPNGVVITGGDEAKLEIQLAGTTVSTLEAGALTIPAGTTAQRPSSPTVGMIRYNTTLNYIEEYREAIWQPLSNVFTANGGTETTYSSGGLNYKVHTFTSSGTFTVVAGTTSVSYLIVAGGGGGATDADVGGGGGAGGVIVGTTTVTPQLYSITVGGGGARGTGPDNTDVGGGSNGGNGGNSIAFGLSAIGGGAGATRNTNGIAGGSGGGGGDGSPSTRPGGAGTAGQGFAGGESYLFNENGGNDSGGGGGAGGAANRADPGPGISNSLRTGSAVTYAAGGRGSQLIAPFNSAVNSGNGGVGCRDGGSGIVVIRYQV